MEITKLILAAFTAALLGACPPGLVNMAVAKISLEKNHRNGIYAAIGASIVNFFHALIGILTAKYIISHPKVYLTILEIGMIVFACLAIYFFLVPKKVKPAKETLTKKDSRRSFVKGFLVANLNILPIPYFVFISMSFAPKGTDTFTWTQIILFSAAAMTATFSMLYIYVVSFVKLEDRLKSLTKNSNYIMGGLMIILFLITLIRVYNA